MGCSPGAPRTEGHPSSENKIHICIDTEVANIRNEGPPNSISPGTS